MNPPPRRPRIPQLAVPAAVALVVAALCWFAFRSPTLEEFDCVARAEPSEREVVIRDVTRTCPAELRPELLRRVAALENGRDLALAVLAATLDTDPANADPVLKAYLEHCPGTQIQTALRPVPAGGGSGPVSQSCLGTTLRFAVPLRQGRFDEAARLYLEAAGRAENDNDRRYFTYQFVQRMMDAGRPLEGYSEADPRDRLYAFRVLAGRLAEECERHDPKAVSRLRVLIAEHTRRVGPDPWTAFFAGQADEGERDDEAAQRHYAQAMQGLEEAGFDPRRAFPVGAAAVTLNSTFPVLPGVNADRQWDLVRHHRVCCLCRLGRWEQAYDESEPAEVTFHWLAQVFEQPNRTDDLERLVERHRKRCPADGTIPYWQAIVHWNRGEYAPAIPHFEEHLRLGKIPYLFQPQAEGRRFRCFVRLGRLDEARAACVEA
jgi:tetratricopeptide (TPR) repeat protein